MMVRRVLLLQEIRMLLVIRLLQLVLGYDTVSVKTIASGGSKPRADSFLVW